MTTRMLIDARHQEETRVAVLKGNRIEEFDFESADKKQIKGNIYLAKVTRVEPSLQAAFVDYGGNRHGFLAFSEIHPDYYQIPMADRQALPLGEMSVQQLAALRLLGPAGCLCRSPGGELGCDATPSALLLVVLRVLVHPPHVVDAAAGQEGKLVFIDFDREDVSTAAATQAGTSGLLVSYGDTGQVFLAGVSALAAKDMVFA